MWILCGNVLIGGNFIYWMWEICQSKTATLLLSLVRAWLQLNTDNYYCYTEMSYQLICTSHRFCNTYFYLKSFHWSFDIIFTIKTVSATTSCLHTPCLSLVNPLLPNGNYSYRIIKISFPKIEGTKKQISYKRRVYESVDDESLS